MARKIIWAICRVVITLCAWIVGGLVLRRYEYFIAFTYIDNIVGMLPVTLAVVGAGSLSALLWMKHTRQFAPATAVLGLFVVLSVVLFPVALRGNWWINMEINHGQEVGFDLTNFAPFVEDSQLVQQNDESTLILYENLPILDGATALFPVYAAFAQAVFDAEAFTPEHLLVTGTRSAYEALIAGERDIIFVAGAAQTQIEAARAAGTELYFTPIGREAFVFIVGRENPIYDITYQQIRNIYSGKTAYWHTLGWPEGGRIIAWQRPEGSGSQTGLQMIMGDLPIQVPQPLPDAGLIGTNSLMQQVSVWHNGVQPAIGYSYRFFATTMYANPDARLLYMDGTAPTVENINDGTYPFVDNFYAVTNGEPTGNVQLLINWILSPQGQWIIEETGYVPIMVNYGN